jgi:hypothetical protein
VKNGDIDAGYILVNVDEKDILVVESATEPKLKNFLITMN